MTDSIERPAHYCFGQMEAREIIELAIADIPDPVAAYHVATTLKYFLRTSRKGWTEDIAKGCKHAGWALDAAKAHDIRKLRDIPPPHYDPDSVAFRHGEVYRCYPPVTDVYRYAQHRKRAGNDTFSTCLPGGPVTGIAQVMAERDGAGDYGNPVAPGCATPWRLP